MINKKNIIIALLIIAAIVVYRKWKAKKDAEKELSVNESFESDVNIQEDAEKELVLNGEVFYPLINVKYASINGLA